MTNLVLGEKGTVQKFSTNTDVKIMIKGKNQFKPPAGPSQRLLAMYANVWLPKPLTPEREAICRGGWRAWFQQIERDLKIEPDGRDETGYKSPIAIPRFGDHSLLISHAWPHGVDADPWEFCFTIFAYDEKGNRKSIPLKLGTRQVKMIHW